MADLAEIMGMSTQVMFGENAVHVPFHGIVQDGGPGIVMMCFASKLMPVNPLKFGARETHVFIQGDMIIRPRNVYATEHLIGTGAAGLFTCHEFASLEPWREKGRCIVDEFSRVRVKG